MSDVVGEVKLSEKRPRGRPVGSKGKSAKFQNYNPKKWPPHFTEIVVLKATSQITNQELAQRFGLTAQHISNICCTPQAEEIREGLRKRVLEESKGGIASRLARLQDKALSKVEQFMDREDLIVKSPFETVDKALKILSGTKVLVENEKGSTVVNNNVNVQQNNAILNLGEDLKNRLMEGLQRSLGIPLHDPDKVAPSVDVEK